MLHACCCQSGPHLCIHAGHLFLGQSKCSSHAAKSAAPYSPVHIPCRSPKGPNKKQASASSTCCSFIVKQADAALLLAHQHLMFVCSLVTQAATKRQAVWFQDAQSPFSPTSSAFGCLQGPHRTPSGLTLQLQEVH